MRIAGTAAFVAALSIFAFTGIYFEGRVSAQTGRNDGKGRKDPELLAEIRGRTNRTSAGLAERLGRRGGSMLDLAGRYQNVMLARLDEADEPVAACVTDLAEANQFLGRDLETGRSVGSPDLLRHGRSADAARHGMTLAEYEFYGQMASAYAAENAAVSPASAVFNIVNNDGPGEGFNDASPAFVVGEGGNTGTTRGEQRLNVFKAAAAVWASFLDSTVPTNVSSQFNPISGCTSSGGVLGSAGTINVHRNFPNAEFGDTWYHAALANKRAGTDLNTSNAEMQAQFNSDIDLGCLGSGTRFYYGLDNATPPGRVNLFVVVLHEIGHGVGFSSFVNSGTGAFLGTPASPDIYSRYMLDTATGKYWHEMSATERQASAINVNNVFWDGPSVRAESAYLTAGFQPGTGRVNLFTPNPVQSGSSVSHFSNSAFPNLLMEPNITAGLPLTLDLARQLMRDIGWYRDSTGDNVEDTIANVSPGSSTVIAGQAVTISWTNNGGFARNVTIEYSPDGGTTWSPVATNVVNVGSFAWTVPSTSTTQGRVRIREAGFASPSAVSQTNFTITSAQPSLPSTVSGRVYGPYGRGQAGSTITFSDGSGNAFVTVSNWIGYFNLSGLPTGRTYTVTVNAKNRTFNSQTVNVVGNLTGLDFTAIK